MTDSPFSAVKSVASERVLQRLDSLLEIFTNNMAGHFSSVYPDRKLMRHVVECYFSDLDRMKGFHHIHLADQHKRAAFTMYWIVRIHPIQLASDVNIKESHLVINEIFAIHAGLSHINADTTRISSHYFRHLLYLLHFRLHSPEMLASSMYTLECAITGKQP